MSKIMIRQLEERVATNGLFMGNTEKVKDSTFRRKLEPGEVVEVPDDLELPDGRNLMQALWKTGSIDIVPDTVAVTRPLDYKNRREAMLCSPSFNPTGPDEELEMQETRERVERELFESSDSPPVAESPEEDSTEPETEPEPPPVAAAPARRTRRGTRPQATDHGAAIST